MIDNIKLMLTGNSVDLDIDDITIETIIENSKKTFKRLYTKTHHSWYDDLLIKEDTLSWIHEYSLAQCKLLITEIRAKILNLVTDHYHSSHDNVLMMELAANRIAYLETELSII